MPKPLVIDLSHHNTVKSLHDTAAAGIVGVIHKATEGTRYKDSQFVARFSLARDAGMLFGAYHFIRPGRIIDQAQIFLRHLLANHFNFDRDLLVLDYEVDGVTLDEVCDWLEEVEKVSGQVPVLYSGSYLKDAIKREKGFPAELSKYRLWIPQYGPKVVLPKSHDDWWLWQYTESGKIAGITGNADLNAYNGTAEQLKNDWVIKTSAAAPLASSEDQGGNQTNLPESSTDGQPPSNSNTVNISGDGKATVINEASPDKASPDLQVIYKEKASAWSKVWAGICAFFSFLWSMITGWYATDFAKPLIDKARDNAASNVTFNMLPQIAVLIGAVVVIGFIAVLFLWLGVWVWNREKNRVHSLNEKKAELAADRTKATVEFTTKPAETTAQILDAIRMQAASDPDKKNVT